MRTSLQGTLAVIAHTLKRLHKRLATGLYWIMDLGNVDRLPDICAYCYLAIPNLRSARIIVSSQTNASRNVSSAYGSVINSIPPTSRNSRPNGKVNPGSTDNHGRRELLDTERAPYHPQLIRRQEASRLFRNSPLLWKDQRRNVDAGVFPDGLPSSRSPGCPPAGDVNAVWHNMSISDDIAVIT
jgi:hypothetical protein